jgi:hypothetical protein
MALTPVEQTYALAMVACAEADERDVIVRVNAEDVGHWLVTTAWKMHTLVVRPRTLKPGVNSVEFVLAPTRGDNPVAIAISSLHVGPLETSAHADAAAPSPSGSLVDGYYAREGEGEQGTSWSAGTKTEVSLLLTPLNAPYQVELTGAAFGPLQPLSVQTRVNGQSAGSANLDKMRKYTFDVPAGALVEGSNLVELIYPRTLKPSEVDSKSSDSRDIAVRIARVSVKPATRQ